MPTSGVLNKEPLSGGVLTDVPIASIQDGSDRLFPAHLQSAAATSRNASARMWSVTSGLIDPERHSPRDMRRQGDPVAGSGDDARPALYPSGMVPDCAG